MIGRFRETHGDRYDYSRVAYKNSSTKVFIVCPDHGVFQQYPRDHLRGCGCPHCAGNVQYTTETYIIVARNKWGDLYKYDKTVFKGSHELITIGCRKHGYFLQQAMSHLAGHGCPKCASEKNKKLVYGVGTNDIIGAKGTDAYTYWHSMLQRCYSKRCLDKHPTYIGCRVCDQWLTFSNFKRWFDENHSKGYHLDKDIIVKGNKVYSPETCCFVPKRINTLIISHHSRRGEYPVGVTYAKRVYRSRSLGDSKKHLYFSTPEEAFYAYKERKEQYVKELAEKYFKEGRITERVYHALLNYRVEITD